MDFLSLHGRTPIWCPQCVALEALRDAWSQKKLTMDDLWHYANIDRVANVMRPYLESIAGCHVGTQRLICRNVTGFPPARE